MALKSSLTIWSPSIGDVFFGSAQAGAIGASFGNGAAQFGQNAANPYQIGDDGNIGVQISSAGVQPAITGADNIVAIYTLTASAAAKFFDIANRGVNIMACGSMTNAATTKTIKMIVNPTSPVVGQNVSGGTTIASLTDATANSAGGWQIGANIFKYGAAGSNTQMAFHEASQSGTVIGALVAPTALTMNESAPMTIVITANAAVAANIVFNFLQIFAMN